MIPYESSLLETLPYVLHYRDMKTFTLSDICSKQVPKLSFLFSMVPFYYISATKKGRSVPALKPIL